MQNNILECTVNCNGPGLHLTLSIDNTPAWQGDPSTINNSVLSLPWPSTDVDSHLFCVELSGKTSEHTRIDNDGRILQDIFVKLSQFKINSRSADELVWKLAVYKHNYNNNGPDTAEKFYGIMGCNGKVELQIGSPVSVWLSEHT